MLVKISHKDYPGNLQGQWVTHNTERDELELQACCFGDLKLKDFISTCITKLQGSLRVTIHYGLVNRPQVARHYLFKICYQNGHTQPQSLWQLCLGRCMAY